MSYLSDEDYNFIYSRAPRICVDLLIRSTSGILLTKRSIEPYKDHWHFPGGRIKFRETVQDAIQRILKGELGQVLDVNPSMIGFCEFLEEVQNGSDRHSISLVHLIDLPENISVQLDQHAKDFMFFTSMPDPVIPPQKEFLSKNKFL